jgi:hypothetical protein
MKVRGRLFISWKGIFGLVEEMLFSLFLICFYLKMLNAAYFESDTIIKFCQEFVYFWHISKCVDYIRVPFCGTCDTTDLAPKSPSPESYSYP